MFYINNIIKEVVFAAFYIYIFDFITHSYNAFINLSFLLIHCLYSEMVKTVLFDILSSNSKC